MGASGCGTRCCRARGPRTQACPRTRLGPRLSKGPALDPGLTLDPGFPQDPPWTQGPPWTQACPRTRLKTQVLPQDPPLTQGPEPRLSPGPTCIVSFGCGRGTSTSWPRPRAFMAFQYADGHSSCAAREGGRSAVGPDPSLHACPSPCADGQDACLRRWAAQRICSAARFG